MNPTTKMNSLQQAAKDAGLKVVWLGQSYGWCIFAPHDTEVSRKLRRFADEILELAEGLGIDYVRAMMEIEKESDDELRDKVRMDWLDSQYPLIQLRCTTTGTISAKSGHLRDAIDNAMADNAELSGPRPLAAEGSRSNDGLERTAETKKGE